MRIASSGIAWLLIIVGIIVSIGPFVEFARVLRHEDIESVEWDWLEVRLSVRCDGIAEGRLYALSLARLYLGLVVAIGGIGLLVSLDLLMEAQ